MQVKCLNKCCGSGGSGPFWHLDPVDHEICDLLDPDPVDQELCDLLDPDPVNQELCDLLDPVDQNTLASWIRWIRTLWPSGSGGS